MVRAPATAPDLGAAALNGAYVGATALNGAYFGAKALHGLCKLNGMRNILTDHMRVFVKGDVSIQSLSYAAEAERIDRARANRVLMLLDGWDPHASTMSELRARVGSLL